MYCPCESWGESHKKNEGVGVGEGKEGTACRQTLNFENPVRQQMGLMIGWASQTLLTCVDQRSYSSESQNPTWQKKGKTRLKHVYKQL